MAMEETATNVVAKEEEEEDPVGICFCVEKEGFGDWYVIKSDGTRDGEFLPRAAFSDMIPLDGGFFHSTCVALGSVLYVLGGHEFFSGQEPDESIDPTKEVFCIDTLNPDRGWTRCPPMAMSRVNAQVFTFRGKIYVAGGYLVPKARCLHKDQPTNFDNYVEVFDPEEAETTRCWRPATDLCNSIPPFFRDNYIDALGIKETKSGEWVLTVRLLVLGDVQLLFKYNFNTNVWIRWSGNKFGTSYIDRNVIFVDDILYSYVKNASRDRYLDHRSSYRKDYNITRGSILCFDSNKPPAKPKEVVFSEEDLHLFPEPSDGLVKFLHLSGSKFCLIWNEFKWIGPDEDDYHLGLTCLTFTVSKKPSPSSSVKEQQVDFLASNVSKSVHFVNAQQILDAFPIRSSQQTSKGNT